MLKEGKPLPHFDLPWRLAAKVDAKVSDIVSENVVGVLPGSDADVARRASWCLTAHLDHLGVASVGEGDRVFNGAMDNASGIAVLLQIARDLAKKKAPRRTIVFAAVTAEELGLLGSRAYVNEARSRGQQIVANLNTDMFMPLYPMKQVVVFGLEESDLADDARWIAAELGIDVQTDPQPQRNRFIRSDQYSFIRVGIPALATKIGVSRPIRPRRRSTASGSPSVTTQSRIQPINPWISPRSANTRNSSSDWRCTLRIATMAPRWYDTSVFSRLAAP